MSVRVGVIAAVFAAFTWSLNFLAPFFIADYSLADLAVARFIVSGVVGSIIVFMLRDECLGLSVRDWVVAAALGFIGYVGYFIVVMISAVFAGPVVPPAFLGLVPVILAIVGNSYNNERSWARLAMPLLLALAGLFLVNVSSIMSAGEGEWTSEKMGGACAAVMAVLLWTWFGIANQKALAKRPGVNSWIWTSMMMIGGSVQAIIFIPVGLSLDLFRFGRHDPYSVYALFHLYAPAITLALVASIAGAWAWTVASRRLPITLAGQLLTMEMVFATCFGLLVHKTFPTIFEVCGLAVLLFGVIKAISTFDKMEADKNISGGRRRVEV